MFDTYYANAMTGTYDTQEEAMAALTASLKAPGLYEVLQGKTVVYSVAWAAPEADAEPAKK